MRTSRGLNTKIRAYQREHGVNYTTARRAVLAAGTHPNPADLPPLLMPFPDGPLNIPPGLSRDDTVKAAVGSVIDHLTANAAACPARDGTGALTPPPVEHLRHRLALDYELGEEEDLLIARSVTSIAVLTELPKCWKCTDAARYDVNVHVEGRTEGIGAYVCPTHYNAYGTDTLGGIDGDTYLMLTNEVPEVVQDEVNLYMTAQGRGWVAFDKA